MDFLILSLFDLHGLSVKKFFAPFDPQVCTKTFSSISSPIANQSCLLKIKPAIRVLFTMFTVNESVGCLGASAQQELLLPRGRGGFQGWRLRSPPQKHTDRSKREDTEKVYLLLVLGSQSQTGSRNVSRNYRVGSLSLYLFVFLTCLSFYASDGNGEGITVRTRAAAPPGSSHSTCSLTFL